MKKYRLKNTNASMMMLLENGEFTQEEILSYFEPIEEKEEEAHYCCFHCPHKGEHFKKGECPVCSHAEKPQQIEKLNVPYMLKLWTSGDEVEKDIAFHSLLRYVAKLSEAWNKEHHD